MENIKRVQTGDIVKLQKPNQDTYININGNTADCSICKAKDVNMIDHICQTMLHIEMVTTLKDFRNLKESLNNIKFVEETLNYHHNQYDMHMDAIIDNQIVAYADYSLYQGKIYIKMIESFNKGMGYGTELMKELAKRYGYENLERSQLTPDGVKMRKKLDNYFKFDYIKFKNSQNKHINIDVIKEIRSKYPIIADFLSDVVLYGKSKAWKKHISKIKQYENTDEFKKLNIDFNDIADISEWIKDSIENDNLSEDEVPEHIINDLDKIK